MAEHDQDTAGEGGGKGQSDWVADLLGERWETDGDGIYRLVERLDPAATGPAVSEHELLADLEPPAPHPDSGRVGDVDEPARGRRWLRR